MTRAFLLILVALFATPAWAADYTIRWSAVTQDNVGGALSSSLVDYEVFYSTTSGGTKTSAGTTPGNHATAKTIIVPTNGTYYITVQAYLTATPAQKSAYSSEIVVGGGSLLSAPTNLRWRSY